MLKYILPLVLLVSCGKHFSHDTSASKKPVKIEKDNDNSYTCGKARCPQTNKFAVKNFLTTADTFTFFFFPKENSIHYDSPIGLFKKKDSHVDKLTAIIASILNNSKKIDEADTKSYLLSIENKKLETQMEELNCTPSPTNPNREKCDELDAKYEANDMDMINFSTTIKSKLSQKVQMSLDNVKFETVDDEVVMKGEFKNWQDYGTAAEYTFDLTNKKDIKIVLPTLGNRAGGNFYSTEDGSIYDVKMVPSEYSKNIAVLKFKVKEKNEKGLESGYIWDIELEKSDFIGKIRFSGDVFRKKKGKVVQEGVMKFELGVKEEF